MICVYCGTQINKKSNGSRSTEVCKSKECWLKNKAEKLKKWRQSDRGKISERTSSLKWREKNKEKAYKISREYGKKTKWAASKKWADKNNERVKETRRKWYLAAIAKDPEYARKSRLRNLEKSREASRRWKIKHRNGSVSPAEILNDRIRSHVNSTLKRFRLPKKSSTFEMLEYTPIDLAHHLESLFIFGMTWKNYGEWHIDHIKPVSFHDFKSERDVKKCWSLKNLKPRWATTKTAEKYGAFEEGNINKGNRYVG